MTTLAAFLFVIGIIILVHELGHFLVARWCGVRVEVFSLGFGPRLITIRYGATDYCISAIPLGGYVKMAGTGPDDDVAADGFLAKSKWQRCQILVAGPVMNLLLATVVIAGIAMNGIDLTTSSTEALSAPSRATALRAAQAGITWTADTAGDVLQSMHGLVTREISMRELAGPLGIAQLAGEAAQISWMALFSIMALLSVNVGIFNLLPIPLLDGGHILMLAIEAVMRRDLTAPERQIVARTGVTTLLILTAITFYNDLSRFDWLQRLLGA